MKLKLRYSNLFRNANVPNARMNDHRQIATESRYNFHILPHFNSETTELIFTNFLYDVEALAPLWPICVHLHGDMAFHFRKSEQIVKRRTYLNEAYTGEIIDAYHSYVLNSEIMEQNFTKILHNVQK